jgi:hypothetical protein
MKRIMIITAALAMLAGCAETAAQSFNKTEETANTVNETQTETSAQEPVPEGKTLEITGDADLLYSLSDPKSIAAYSTYVVTADIIRVDGCDTYNASADRYGEIYTYGQMRIRECYMGELTPGSEVTFVRAGGNVPWDLYEKSLYETEKEKISKEISEIPEYVSYRHTDDIDVEEGKTYLMFLWQSDMPAIEGSLAINGYQGGLREYNSETGMVLNNISGEWEELSEIVSSLQK